MKFGGFNVIADVSCATWRTIHHGGWRGFLIYRCRLPRRWFKPERKERVFFQVGQSIYCSYETYAFIRKESG